MPRVRRPCFIAKPRRILGFYTLVAIEFRDDEMPERIARSLKVKGLRSIPGVLLAQFATLDSMQGQGFGKFLLGSALEKCLEAAQAVGAVAVVADTIDERAGSFYRKFDFVPLDPGATRLILPIWANYSDRGLPPRKPAPSEPGCLTNIT